MKTKYLLFPLFLIAALSACGQAMDCTIEDGICTIRNSKGDIQIQGKYLDGKKEGTWTVWDSVGAKNAEMRFENDILNGPSKLFYGSYFSEENPGAIKVETYFTNGKMDRYNKSYLPDGNLNFGFKIENGIPETNFRNAGKIKKRIQEDMHYYNLVLEIINQSIDGV